MTSTIFNILEVLKLAERLKFEMRHSWLSNGRQESVAEHTWQMSLMALLLHRHLEHPVNLERSLKMIIVHDLVEAEVGDVPFFETGPRKAAKAERERQAIENLRSQLSNETGEEIYQLWYEFEEVATPEAKFAKAIDNLEVQLQHNLADFGTWEEIEYDLVYNKMDKHCQHDGFLQMFCDAIKAGGEAKMIEHGVDVNAVKQRALAKGHKRQL